MTETAVIVGAGAVGLGLIAPALRQVGLSTTVICGQQGVARRATRMAGVASGYSVVTRRGVEWIGSSEAIDVGDAARVADACARSPMWFVAVNREQTSELLPMLRGPLQERRSRARPTQVVLCQNATSPAELQANAARQLGVSIGAADVAIAAAVVDATAHVTEDDSKFAVHVDADGTIAVDSRSIACGTGLDAVFRTQAFVRADDIAAEARTKLHLQLHAYDGGAFVAAVRGHRDMATALEDPAVRNVAAAALEMATASLRDEARADAGRQALLERRRAMAQRALGSRGSDPVARNCRHPARKVARDERLWAPLRLIAARGHDVSPSLELLAAGVVVSDAVFRLQNGSAVANRLARSLGTVRPEALGQAVPREQWLLDFESSEPLLGPLLRTAVTRLETSP